MLPPAEMTAKATEKPTTTRMFQSDFIEKFSRVHPATPFVVYVPLLSWVLYRSVVREQPAPGYAAIAGLVFTGVLVWTLTEYLLHRYVFHWVNETAWGKRVHFILHGVHHDFPNDKDRLVMPLGASIPMAILFYVMYRGLFGIAVGEPLYIGMGIGYLAYDGTHYAVHHFKQTSRIGKYVKRHHMLHHHADHSGGFGVSSPIWDVVFGTMPQVKKLAATRASSS